MIMVLQITVCHLTIAIQVLSNKWTMTQTFKVWSIMLQNSAEHHLTFNRILQNIIQHSIEFCRFYYSICRILKNSGRIRLNSAEFWRIVTFLLCNLDKIYWSIYEVIDRIIKIHSLWATSMNFKGVKIRYESILQNSDLGLKVSSLILKCRC